jgi:hypothetical protein
MCNQVLKEQQIIFGMKKIECFHMETCYDQTKLHDERSGSRQCNWVQTLSHKLGKCKASESQVALNGNHSGIWGFEVS